MAFKIKISDNRGGNEKVMTGKDFVEFAKDYIRKTNDPYKKVSDIKTVGDAGQYFRNKNDVYARPVFTSRKKYGFKIIEGNWNRRTGSSTNTIVVYDGYKQIGETQYSTNSTKGPESEAYKVLYDKGIVDKNSYEMNNGYYRYDNSPVELIQL